MFHEATPETPAPPTDIVRVPLRNEIPTSDTWDLTPLYPSVEAWEADFKSYESDFPGVLRFKGRMGESPETLLECLEFVKAMDLRSERLWEFSSLQAAEDGASDEFMSRSQRMQSLETRASEAGAFISPELQAIDDARWEILVSHPLLAPWQVHLRKIRRFRPHTLSADEERLMALASDALYGYSTVFSQLTNVDMKFGTLRTEKGQEKELSQSSYSSFLVSRSGEVRKAAFHQFYAEFADHKQALAAMLSQSVKVDVFNARSRRYPSALEAALFRDDVPISVYDNLCRAVRGNLDPLFDYFELRREVLGLKEIHHYDTYVPLVDSVQTDTPFDEAVELVVRSLKPLGDDYVQPLRAGLLERRWVDRFETKGKKSGAFSSGSYGNPPYILMNYKRDVFSDVYTLAHEAGHSMHTWFSQQTQPFQDYRYTIFVAEVASTFNETLLTEHLLQTNDDPKFRAFIINRQIDDIRGTIYRQTMFAEFERKIHAMQEAGEALTLQSFRKCYRELLDVYFGPKFSLDSELELECLRIPHFYSAFYVYKYATGLSAALTLANKVLSEGSSAREAYLNFLKAGGSLMPLDALRLAGVDMSRPEPVESALQLFARRVKELRQLLKP